MVTTYLNSLHLYIISRPFLDWLDIVPVGVVDGMKDEIHSPCDSWL